LEEIAVCGSVTFKETHDVRDSVADPTNPWKVLGLIGDTVADQLQMDVKFYFSGKQKRTRLDPTQTWKRRWTPSPPTGSQKGAVRGGAGTI
jgi:hypothetical protein